MIVVFSVVFVDWFLWLILVWRFVCILVGGLVGGYFGVR